MAKIKTIDMRLLNEVFASPSGPGYVLDFSNQTFSMFFRNDLDIDIYDTKYSHLGTSKGNRLRAFFEIEDEQTVAKALRALWEYREGIYGTAQNQNDKEKQVRFLKLVQEMEGGCPSAAASKSKMVPHHSMPPSSDLFELNSRLLQLTAMKPQQRGFAFEKFLSDLFGLYDLDPRHSFRLVGEQIDGSFEIPPETFLLEAKWQSELTGQSDLLTFSGKVEGKAQWSQGLFVSYTGFSQDGLDAFIRGRRTSIICMDGLDLTNLLSNQLNFVDVIQRKKRRAAETGRAFVPVRDLFPAIN